MSINFERWDENDYFEIWQAACLWIEIDPPMDLEGYALLKLNNKDVDLSYRGLLSAHNNHDISFSKYEGFLELTVTRQDLLALAKKRGMKPLFLFPKGAWG